MRLVSAMHLQCSSHQCAETPWNLCPHSIHSEAAWGPLLQASTQLAADCQAKSDLAKLPVQ